MPTGVDECKINVLLYENNYVGRSIKEKIWTGCWKSPKFKNLDIIALWQAGREGLTTVPQVGDEEDKDFNFGVDSRDTPPKNTNHLSEM